MTSIVFCPHCGTANRSGSRFCNNCGTELAGSVASPDSRLGEAESTASTSTPPPAASGRDALSARSATESSRAADPLLAEMLRSQPWLDPALEEAEIASEQGEQAADKNAGGDNDDDNSVDIGRNRAEVFVGGSPPAESLPPRLLGDIPGLIEPLAAASQPGTRPSAWVRAQPSQQPQQLAPNTLGIEMSDDEARQFRTIMSEPPVLLEPLRIANRDGHHGSKPVSNLAKTRGAMGEVNASTDSATNSQGTRPDRRARRRRPWIFWLVALALLAPFVLDLFLPGGLTLSALGSGEPPRWPGVVQAYAAVRDLPADSDVLIYWAYGPATAGEMDNVALPVVRHLLARRARLIVVSSLPQGPATARRLLVRAREGSVTSNPLADAAPVPVELGYLPGGAATLPLLARNLNALPLASSVSGFSSASIDETNAVADRIIAPVLVILIAAETEDVQRWLEQVQPYTRADDGDSASPVVALTSAAIDPTTRAYWQSEQLAGLVSGFNAAQQYRLLLANSSVTRPDRAELRTQQLRLIAQNWGHWALLVIVVAGNAAALLGGRT